MPSDQSVNDNALLDVSILIKTFNEESRIGPAIESALEAITPPLTGEVIVADSLSTDRTLEIAADYPVAVVQLTRADERCCSIGPQLGYQYSGGEFIYILDGDMELDRKFLLTAINLMHDNTHVVGVAGIVEELGGDSYEFLARKGGHNSCALAGDYPWLDMGGLYRRSALEQIGYLSNRNLHACEEQELGLRLFAEGGRLVRLPMRSVRHHGRDESSWELMKKRLSSGYSDGPGELLRAALGKPYLWQAVGSHAKLLAMAMLMLATLAGVGALPLTPWPVAVIALLYSLLFLLLRIRKHSLRLAALGMLNWLMRTLGFIRGLLAPQTSPRRWVESCVMAWPGTPPIEAGEQGSNHYRYQPPSDGRQGAHAHIGKLPGPAGAPANRKGADKLKRSATETAMAKGDKDNAAPCSLIFVTGASRSGTSMLARLLGRHQTILMLQEMHYFGALCDPVQADRPGATERMERLAATLLARHHRSLWDSQPTAAERREARALINGLSPQVRSAAGVFTATLRHLAAVAGNSIALEQTPRNIFYAEHLLALYPEARIVHIVRDPRAVLASQRNRWRMRQLGAAHIPVFEMLRNWVNYHPITMSKLWNEANQRALSLQRQKRFLLVRFEDLVENPQAETRRICSFLGITFEPTMLNIPRWGSSNIAHSTRQRGISREVKDLWRECLPAADRSLCEQLTASTMQRFGYRPLPVRWAARLGIWAKVLTYPLHLVGVISLNPKRAWTLLKALKISHRQPDKPGVQRTG